VKFDLLGLKTLTVIAKTEELLKARGLDVKTERADFMDKPTFEMLARGETLPPRSSGAPPMPPAQPAHPSLEPKRTPPPLLGGPEPSPA